MSKPKFDVEQWYVLDGEIMNKLWSLTEQLVSTIDPTVPGWTTAERRAAETGQKMQAHLERSPRLAKKIARLTPASRNIRA